MYKATVSRKMQGPQRGDYASIWELDLREYDEPSTATNTLRHNPPVKNNVSHYSGIFDTEEDAIKTVIDWFPEAHLR